jgi:malonyl-CoA/methylmalonyl-CoA synthetase
MTETGMLTSNPLAGDRRPGSVGPALPGTEVRVVDDHGGACPASVIGHVQVRGANVFQGYWRMPEKNREEFTPDGYFRTGDVGSLSNDGYLTIVGRSKDLIITGGYNVYPCETRPSTSCLACGVGVGRPQPDFGEAVTAVAPRRRVALGGRTPSQHSSRALAELGSKRVYVVENLPRTPWVWRRRALRVVAATRPRALIDRIVVPCARPSAVRIG